MILTYNKSLIKNTLGKQGSSQCGVYSIAYGYTILEKKCRVSGSPASHSAVAKAYNPNAFAVCYWGSDGLTSHMASSTTSRYKAIIEQLNKGKPVVVAVQGSSANHYILVIGVRDGKTANTVKESDFFIIDPADCGIGWFGSTWAHGFNRSSYGLQYCTFNTNKSAGKGGAAGGHDRKWYVDKYGIGADVYFELKSYGYSHKACCAVLGNMEQESSLRLETGGSFDGNNSEGLCQWTFGRRGTMMNYAKKHSKSGSWKSVDGQVAYLVWELKNTEKAANKVLKNDSLSLEEMTLQFEKAFERADPAYANMPARYKYAHKWDERMKGAGEGGESSYIEDEEGTGTGINMQQRASQLYSSDNYKWITDEEQKEKKQSQLEIRQTAVKDFLNNIRNMQINLDVQVDTGAVPDYINIAPKLDFEKTERASNAVLDIAGAMVEAPFIEIDFAGVKVGTYNNSLDQFPNHITKLEVEKVNGQIHKYAFDIIHQIRPGEDPNLIDKVISKVRYDTITIKYGDCNSNVVYSDEKAIITNVSMNRDYVGNRISYTVYATSAGEFVTSHKLNFPARTDKLSNIIYDMLYNIQETSQLLLDAFPGMKNKELVTSKNLIPSNDTVVSVDEKYNISTIEYLNYLVSCMSNATNDVEDIIRNSVYYITYESDSQNKMGGSYFKIHELHNDSINSSNTNNIFSVTVGYPDNNYVMAFNVDNDTAWSLLYEKASISGEYIYEIDDGGNTVKDYSPNLFSSSSQLNETQKNWWTQMVNFPINASLTLKGLMKPIMLMDYIIVDVVFYGQRHITSGIYVVTGQKDVLSGDGFRTILSLTRIGG